VISQDSFEKNKSQLWRFIARKRIYLSCRSSSCFHQHSWISIRINKLAEMGFFKDALEVLFHKATSVSKCVCFKKDCFDPTNSSGQDQDKSQFYPDIDRCDLWREKQKIPCEDSDLLQCGVFSKNRKCPDATKLIDYFLESCDGKSYKSVP